MDILYFLGNGSEWENNELRYSLRSVEKYCKNYDRVFVVGDNPKFLSKEVRFYPFVETKDRSHNILDKLNFTFSKTDISDDVFFMMDDIFLLKEVDCQNYEFYWRGYLPQRIKNHDGYNNSLENTRNELLSRCLDIKHFGCHLPIIYNRQKFQEIDWSFMGSYTNGASIRSIYGNYHKITGTNIHDVKIHQIENEADLSNRILGLEAFSSSDAIIHYGLKEYLEKEFPNKSRFEL